MLKIIRSVLVPLLAAALYSACSALDTSPTATAQAPGQSTALPTAQIIGKPTVTPEKKPVASPTVSSLVESPPAILPTDIVQSTVVAPDIVHLGVPWADFSLCFDPLQWEIRAFDDHWPDLQSLTHVTFFGCRITPNIPVGLGESWTIEKTQVTLGQLDLQARYFYQNGALNFVGYYNFLNPYGDGAVEVHFVDDSADCIQAAEALFADTEVILP